MCGVKRLDVVAGACLVVLLPLLASNGLASIITAISIHIATSSPSLMSTIGGFLRAAIVSVNVIVETVMFTVPVS